MRYPLPFRPTTALLLLLLPGLAFAQSAGALPWEGPLMTVARSLTGPTAGAVALIALFAAGATLIFGGEMGEFAKRLIYLVIALSLLVGGSALLRMIGIIGI